MVGGKRWLFLVFVCVTECSEGVASTLGSLVGGKWWIYKWLSSRIDPWMEIPVFHNHAWRREWPGWRHLKILSELPNSFQSLNPAFAEGRDKLWGRRVECTSAASHTVTLQVALPHTAHVRPYRGLTIFSMSGCDTSQKAVPVTCFLIVISCVTVNLVMLVCSSTLILFSLSLHFLTEF